MTNRIRFRSPLLLLLFLVDSKTLYFPHYFTIFHLKYNNYSFLESGRMNFCHGMLKKRGNDMNCQPNFNFITWSNLNSMLPLHALSTTHTGRFNISQQIVRFYSAEEDFIQKNHLGQSIDDTSKKSQRLLLFSRRLCVWVYLKRWGRKRAYWPLSGLCFKRKYVGPLQGYARDSKDMTDDQISTSLKIKEAVPYKLLTLPENEKPKWEL